MTAVVISQPMYFPWVGFMAQLALADVLIWLDDAQFSKGSFTNRVQVKHISGVKWMTIPQIRNVSFPRIMDLGLPEADIFQAHRSLLSQSLHSRPFRDQALALFEQATASGSLVDRLMASTEIIAQHWQIVPPRILRSSCLAAGGTSWERVLELVKRVGGTRYITGHGAANYLRHEAFEENGIGVEYMVYAPLPWAQGEGAFTPYVANLDLCASVDADAARHHLCPATVNWKEFMERRQCP
ncbi:MAG: WbqC family protein [Cyanobacteriota bacterium]|jgi:hypothetical protein